MAIIQCPECKKEISDRAKSCPHCGFPLEIVNDSEPSFNPTPQPNEYTDGFTRDVSEDLNLNIQEDNSKLNEVLDFLLQRKENKPVYKKVWFWVAIFFGLLIIGSLGSGTTSQTSSDGPEDGIEIGYSSSEFSDDNYKDVETILRNKGFTNITTEAVPDLKIGLLAKENQVESVSIAGKSSFKKYTRAYADDKIVIRYHTYPENSQQSTDKNQTDSSVSKQTGTKNDKKTVGLNEEFGNSTITAMVVSADLDYKGYNNLWTTVPDGKKCILLVIKMTNISNKSNYVSVGDFSCYVDNVSVSPELISGSEYDYNENIDPGRAAMLGACYVIPANAQSIELQYTPIGEKKDNTIIKIK